MTVAVVGAAGRVAATRAATGAGSRAGAGKVIEGRVINRPATRPASTSSASKPANKPANTRSRSLTGDALGGLVQGSAISRGMRSPSKQAAGPGTPHRRLLVAEFALCMVLVALSPVTDAKRNETPGAWIKRASAIMIVFFVLGLISTGGRGAGRAAAGFGGLVTLGLAISSRSIFTVLGQKVGRDDPTPDPDAEGLDGDLLGDAAAGAGAGAGYLTDLRPGSAQPAATR